MAEITVYTRQLCGYCTAAKRLLSSKGVSFTEHDATFEPDLKKEMIQRANGASTFPQIFFGDQHIGGCDDLMALERQGKLDSVLESARAAS
ncbi:MAG: glutaredoxin 3 [Pseudomonadota bacterium]